ncbi:PUF4 [Coccidioides immitis H538.4]|uniref:PUF4 n=1 Tax=Coccidioides immitis H538.4 TaxID=396776 RepID=A0A0J8RJF3_COCIT|nr:PUF4 [Coccidioides immitis H538.4]
MIFLETHVHVVELMTDPFGNYLCQKLLEFSNDEQRTALINNAAPQLVSIALNQHGTRALQKMIEFISTPEQTQTVIKALRDKVVDLVQDLNGNHVIQKCLNRLSAADAQPVPTLWYKILLEIMLFNIYWTSRNLVLQNLSAKRLSERYQCFQSRNLAPMSLKNAFELPIFRVVASLFRRCCR